MIASGKPSPSVVLICHEDDPIDREGIAAWLACVFSLSGIVLLREGRGSLTGKLRREYRRVGLFRLLDVLLFRVVYQLVQARKDARWVQDKLRELHSRYPAQPGEVPSLTAENPNGDEVRDFIGSLKPDFIVARCKHILKPAIFELPRFGTYVLHPGICPMYRNAHGCFWAMVNRDLSNVGMTLLKVDAGIDTGPAYLHASYAFDETRESHIVIQHRVVLENLDAITRVFHSIRNGTARPLAAAGHRSTNWGQPWFSAWSRWKRSIGRSPNASSCAT